MISCVRARVRPPPCAKCVPAIPKTINALVKSWPGEIHPQLYVCGGVKREFLFFPNVNLRLCGSIVSNGEKARNNNPN